MAYLPAAALMAGSAMANLFGGKNDDNGSLDSRVDANQREQSLYNYKMAETVSGQRRQLKNLKSRKDRLSSRTDKLSDRFGEASLMLGRALSETSSLRRDQDRYGDRFDRFQTDQSSINMDLAKRGAGLEAGLSMFSEQQRSFNDGIKLETAGMQKRLGEHSTGLEAIRSRTESLQHDQDRINLDVTRVDGKVDQLLVALNKCNVDFTDRCSRMEEHQRMFSQQQELFNKDVDSRTVALQESLGNTSTRLELVHARSDLLQRGLDELSLDQRQTNQRIDQFQTDCMQRLQLVSASTARNEEKQLSFMNTQELLNEKLHNRTEALAIKYNDTEGKLELVNQRADTLYKGQDEIDSEMRLERQINEDRLREQIKRNETLSNNCVRVEERQNSFINDQKSHNDQIVNQTENIRDKLGKTSQNVDFVNFRVDSLQNAQQKVELDQKDMDKRLHVLEQYMGDVREEQKQLNETLKALLIQVSEISTRMKMMDGRFDTYRTAYDRVNETCVKFDATGGSLGKSSDEPGHDIICGNNEASSVNKTVQM